MSDQKRYAELLNQAFQYVDDEFLDIVEQEKKSRKRKPVWAIASAVAACLCVLLLPVSAMANNWFGLRDLFLPKEDTDYFTIYDYAASPEVDALREWQQFLAGYDTDGAIWAESIQNGFAPEDREDWLLYGVYSYEMGETLDQIVKRYGLTLHTNRETITFEELQGQVGGSFITDADIEVCQVYEDGSFYVEGNIEVDSCGKVPFTLHCVVKGTLDETIPVWWASADDWNNWFYETAQGEYTWLELGTRRSEILAGTNDRILMAVVHDGRESGITEEILQELADKIDFRVLKDMQLPEISRDKPVPNRETISLSGYMDSPESQALAEWEEFLAHYDTDHKIADGIGNGAFVAEGREDWSLYAVYSYEMGEKLDELAEKYGLRLHTDFNVIDQDELMYRVGGEFMDKEYLTWAFIYEDGMFHVEGDVRLADSGKTGFQFERSVKGTFNEVVLNIGQAEDYTDWQYISSCREPVLLAMGPHKALIFADYEECFITVNVLSGSEDGMTKEDLQELADKIDFRILKDVQMPDMRGDSVVPTDEPLLSEKLHGEVGNLGSGTLITADFCDDKQDYRLYFVADKNGEEQNPNFNERELKPEDADYIFPDAREGNIPIGTFQGFVVFELGDIGRDGTSDILLIGFYGVGEDFCVDSRVYTESGEGYVLNTALTQELNEKYYYYNAMEFPFRKILNDFGL